MFPLFSSGKDSRSWQHDSCHRPRNIRSMTAESVLIPGTDMQINVVQDGDSGNCIHYSMHAKRTRVESFLAFKTCISRTLLAQYPNDRLILRPSTTPVIHCNGIQCHATSEILKRAEIRWQDRQQTFHLDVLHIMEVTFVYFLQRVKSDQLNNQRKHRHCSEPNTYHVFRQHVCMLVCTACEITSCGGSHSLDMHAADTNMQSVHHSQHKAMATASEVSPFLFRSMRDKSVQTFFAEDEKKMATRQYAILKRFKHINSPRASQGCLKYVYSPCQVPLSGLRPSIASFRHMQRPQHHPAPLLHNSSYFILFCSYL